MFAERSILGVLLSFVRRIAMQVSQSALRTRISRKLAKEGERMITFPEATSDWCTNGPIAVVDCNNHMIRVGHDLESLGRELGVLRDYEQV
jgi:hypothetical protein